MRLAIVEGLIDKDFVLRSDSSGHNPRDDLYRKLMPMVSSLLKARAKRKKPASRPLSKPQKKTARHTEPKTVPKKEHAADLLKAAETHAAAGDYKAALKTIEQILALPLKKVERARIELLQMQYKARSKKRRSR